MQEHLPQQSVSSKERYGVPEYPDKKPIPSHAPLAKNLADDISKILFQECFAVLRNVCAAPGRKELTIGGPELLRYFDRHTCEEFGEFINAKSLLEKILKTKRYVNIYPDGAVILDGIAAREIVRSIRKCCHESGNKEELNAIERHLIDLEFKLKEPIKPFVPQEVLGIVQSHTRIDHPADRPRNDGSFTIYMQNSSLQPGYGYASDVAKVREALIQALHKNN